MKNFILFLIFMISSLGNNLLACSCFSFPTFCETAQTDSKIVEVEVLNKYSGSNFETYMDIKIVENLQGTAEEEKLTVISYGTSCDISFDLFEIGAKLIVNFKDLQPANVIVNYPNFSFVACGTSYLGLSNNEVSGSIEPDITTKNYDDFKDDIGACADLSLFDRNIENLSKRISIFSNPTPGMTYIYVRNLNLPEISLELYNASGQFITSIDTDQNEIPLDLSGMAVGIYFLRIKYRELSTVKRIVRI